MSTCRGLEFLALHAGDTAGAAVGYEACMELHTQLGDAPREAVTRSAPCAPRAGCTAAGSTGPGPDR